MIQDQEREEYEAIQREEALKKIQSLVRRYGFDHSDLLSTLPAPIEQKLIHGAQLPERRFDPFFDAW